MQTDIQETALYRASDALCRALHRPGSGLISDAAEVSTNGSEAVFAATLVDQLQGTPSTRIGLTDLASGDTRVLTFGPNLDRSPKFSADGQRIAFLSDRREAGDFQLYLLDRKSGAARPTPTVEGWVEYLHWSPDSQRILLGVAEYGAETSGVQGAVATRQCSKQLPSWMPAVETTDCRHRWRRAWVYELATDLVFPVSPANENIWEAVWCGNDALAAVVSPGPAECLWHSARLRIVHIDSRESRELYTAQDQMGCPAASPSGEHLAIVAALCSDRWVVAGDLNVVETRSGKSRFVGTHGIDITYTEWRSDEHLLLAGHRGFDTVVGLYDVSSDAFTEVWSSSDMTTGGRYIAVSGMDKTGDCVLIGESFMRAPEIGVIRQGRYHAVKSFDVGYADQVKTLAVAEQVDWKAPDGLAIQGWLLRPHGKAPHPLIMNIHGGPVWHWRPTWLGRWGATVLMLVHRGYAVFLPNPRGSAGRGQAFARRVLGEMGGADTDDFRSGLDHLVERGIADPRRIGVTGGSYGGFMTSWLITQDARFAAAVSLAPITNQVSEHLTSNSPHVVALFLADHYTNAGGKYFQRSPVMHAKKVKTPTLNICGALDRCTPPGEALQFHSALLENGVKSVLVTYPEEGHGIRKWPAAVDFTARLVGWFEAHMPAMPEKDFDR